MKHHIWHMLACGLAWLALFVLPAFGVGPAAALVVFLTLIAACMVLMVRMTQHSATRIARKGRQDPLKKKVKS